ncbi:LytR/AlgR family response regulator transcription factor [Alloscardovia macacae]|uniref:DNA-binding response regulator n=1 Tax=Alloscardovia macacae TaxID=1160091 RepID=A0A261F6C7_9BIFI|nr:response regulator transcription factor [Alloscardovia macacae]OZG54680.1 DNA-binding response regulator [Alloscardovia macacae]
MSLRPRIALLSTDKSCITVVQEVLEGQNLSIYSDSQAFLDSYEPEYAVLILDLEMSSHVLPLAERVRQHDAAVRIILLAKSPRYALLGYSLHASAYLLKPLSVETFRTEWNHIRTHLIKPEDTILIPVSGTSVRILISHILFIESVKHTITVHTLEGQISTTLSLTTFEELLSSSLFFRCHASYIVNLTAITEVRDTDCVLTTGEYIRIARNRRKEFLSRLSSTITA